MKKQVAGAEDYNSQLENSVGYVCNLCGKQVWLWPQKAPGMCAQESPVVLTHFLLFIKMHILKFFHIQRDPLTD